jgi:hypothetical protein
MNYLPSKELLSKVLGENIFSIGLLNENMVQYDHSYDFETDTGIFESIHIHELADKCKKWLELKCPSYNIMIVENQVYIMNDIWGEGGASIAYSFSLEKEWYLNLFLACQWKLDKKD